MPRNHSLTTQHERGNTLVETLASLALIGAITLSFAALAVRTAHLTRTLPPRSEKATCTALSCAASPSDLACSCASTSGQVAR